MPNNQIINITSKNTLIEGDNLSLQLTYLNKTENSNQKANITVKDRKRQGCFK